MTARSDPTRAWWRVILMTLVAALVIPLTMVATASVAHADDNDYSLYKAASNASNYFNIKNAPNKGGMAPEWGFAINNPATGGDFLGYGDPQLGPNIIGWLFSSLSGSSQTVSYDTLKTAGKNSKNAETRSFNGLLDYAHFGAANANLGLDHTIQGPDIISKIMNTVGGAIMWVLYGLAIAVSMMFLIVITVLKYLNPFLWFGPAFRGLSANFADGVMRGVTIPREMSGITDFIAGWYKTLHDMSWSVLIPLFLGFLIGGLLLFKRMNRGSALKKFFIRVLFLGVGLPLIGSMYSGILVQFDDLGSTTAGPTRVVLSNYVDFESWMVNNRLAVPNDAVIGWENGRASTEALMKVRNTALAINKQAYGGSAGAFKDVGQPIGASNASSVWTDNSTVLSSDDSLNNEANANRSVTNTEKNSVVAVFNMLGKVISSKTVTPSDFESGIKGVISGSSVNDDIKEKWFKNAYNDPDSYGEGTKAGDGPVQNHPDGVIPTENPIVNVSGDNHLTSSSSGGDSTRFTTPNASSVANCGYTVTKGNGPADCNLSPLAAYNYLNTKFGPDSVTMFSSKNITSNFIRSDHLAVSQVGTGIGGFSYWMQAATTLACLVVLGFWYALGMLMGSVKRILSLITAIPFATLGVLSSIAKVITYTIALILEVLVTMFMYFFVSELLISVPTLMTDAVNGWIAGTRG